MNTRHVEIFSAGCALCEEAIDLERISKSLQAGSTTPGRSDLRAA